MSVNEVNQVRNEIKSYIAKSGWTLTDIVKEYNNRRPASEHTTTQNISNKLSRGTIKYSEVKEIADIIGYDICWVEKSVRYVSAEEFFKGTPIANETIAQDTKKADN